jgi:phosphatidylinositol 4-kinase
MIERLLLNIKECGQVHAVQWQQQWNQQMHKIPQQLSSSTATTAASSSLLSPAEIMELAEAGKIPVDENNGYPNLRHVEVLTGTLGGNGGDENNNRSSLDAHPMMNVTSSSPQHHFSETEQFDKTPQFLDALLYVAENLQFVPIDQRKSILRTHLNRIECELLPSPLVYIPVGSSSYQKHHWVWRIVRDESFPISTKERVPCIIVLEIIVDQCNPNHHPMQQRQSHLRQYVSLANRDHNGNRTDTHNNNNNTTEYDNGNQQHSSLSEERLDQRMDSQLSHSPLHSWWDMSEAEQLELWRFGARDPFRRISLLDKVTSTVKQVVASDKMMISKIQKNLRSSSVDQLPLFRNRHENLDELQALTSSPPQTLMMIPDPPHRSGPINRRGAGSGSGFRAASLSDVEHGSHTAGPAINGNNALPSSSRSVSRTSSGGSLVSLGQWTTPPIVKKLKDKDIESLFWNKNETDTDIDRASPLTYGSDQEEESTSERGVANTFSRPPRAQHSKNPKHEMKTTQSTNKRPPAVVFRESWDAKQERIRKKSAFGNHPGWRLVPILIKANDDLRQEQLASQIIQRMASILARENVPVWLCPYEIIALTDRGGIIEAIPDTISLDSLKKNDPHYTGLRDFFHSHFGDGTEDLIAAKANFVESLAAYSMVCFLLQIKDRHNGNILLDKWGHLIHIDFGFFFLSSPGKNVGFESAPFKLTRDFVDVLDGTDSHLFRTFRDLCVRTFITLRRRCMEIILLVEMLKNGNEELQCFRGRPDDAIQQLRDRFRLDLNDRACREYVNSLVDASIENWRTDWYDRYQRYFVGVL